MIQDVAFAGPGVRLTDRIGLGVLTRLIGRDVIDEVLAETGRTERRSRLLPARVVVYYVLALCLFFGEGYEEVIRRLVLNTGTPTDSAPEFGSTGAFLPRGTACDGELVSVRP